MRAGSMHRAGAAACRVQPLAADPRPGAAPRIFPDASFQRAKALFGWTDNLDTRAGGNACGRMRSAPAGCPLSVWS